MNVKRRFSTRWGHPYHLQGACAKCRQTLLCPLCLIPSMIPESYMEWPAQSKGEDPPDAALALMQQALARTRTMAQPYGVAIVLSLAATLHLLRGDVGA